MLRAAFWAVSLAAVAGLFLWYRSELRRRAAPPPVPRLAPPSDAAPAVLLHVGADGPSDFLTRRELASVNAAAGAWKAEGGAGPIAIIAPLQARGLCAKVVLHSWGLGPGEVRVFEGLERCGVGGRVRLAPDFPRETAARLRGAGADLLAARRVELKALPAPAEVRGVAIVLGNEPLDASTPTIDLVRRALKGVEYYARRRDALLVFTGGPTTGGLSEAKMMALVAASRGVPEGGFRLEEQASSTRQNALFTAKMFAGRELARVVVVSKESHLEAAMPFFRAQPGFEGAEPLACGVTGQEIIRQMKEYLEIFESPRVRARLRLLEAGRHGVD